METGNPQKETNLHIEKLSIEIESLNLNSNTIGLTLIGVYLSLLLVQLVRNVISWTTWSFVELVLIFLSSLVLFMLDYIVTGYSICIFGLFHHWSCLPQHYISVENKAILVTGCDRGIGYELAKKLDSMGYHVFAGCLFKGQKGEQALVADCSTRLQTLQMDVRNREQVKQAAIQVQAKLGHNKLWAVINNAGICYIGNIEIMSTDDIENVMAINYMGPINVCRAFLPLIRRSKGRLVNVASNAGLAPIPHMGVYCASKAALATFSESLRYELEQWGVKVSTIVPSGYKTGILAYDKTAAAERWWKSASQTVKDDFGKECFTPEFKYENHESSTTPDLSPIVNTIVMAVSVKNPQPFYYSGFLARTLPFVYLHLPSILQEPVMKLLGHWFNFKPEALKQCDKNDRSNKRFKLGKVH
ncbi:estradiol 17-beta-dehydrogenase 2-like [Mercenaria mercenaria]|uniref:estradiol 17-beta-dehydrogenase 2-like n=1 Tax=Mercenaria mercenaria TaxID=6596 RepID=UPI00234F7CE4|nr:estradiol 17-beta-dehydrogenase 2-like [Mercenaria mercenaria]